MFEKIISINKNYAKVQISSNLTEDILNYNVVFEDPSKKILGEIKEINDNIISVFFLGEFYGDNFNNGIIRKPNINSKIRLINEEELKIIAGANDKNSIVLGESPLYNNYPIRININKMFSNHSAFFGNSGSGKTYGISRIVQNLFNLENKLAFNSNIFIFNNNDEYDNAFKDLNKYNVNLNYKMYNTNFEGNNLLRIPLWLLNVDDFANLLDITDHSQIQIIEKMLAYVSIFSRNDDYAVKYKNHLIASAIISVLYTNQTPARIRDQIFSILTDCYTNELNLNVEVPGVGYTRQFRKCFEINSQGEFVERILITNYIQQFVDNSTKWKEDYIQTFFTLEDLETSLNFTLISEGLLLNDKSFSYATALKVKLHSINNSSLKKLFEYDKFVNLNEYITSLLIVDNNKRAQIVNFILEDLDDRFSKNIVKIFSRLLFRFSRGFPEKGTMPIHIMLEEAHRYVQSDNDVNLLGYNIFERIAKEGRKFGVILDLITQRPTELSENVISQCSNFLIYKINNPSDLDYIEKMVPNISDDIIEKQKILQAGTCIAFGPMIHIPMIVKMQKPNPEPKSSNVSIYDKWIVELKK